MTEDEMVGWHHQLDRHEFEQTPRVGDGQGRLACCSPRHCKELDTTEQLNLTENIQVAPPTPRKSPSLNPRHSPMGDSPPALVSAFLK